ncbi:hypothetical protein BsWGS_09310 [Bradybaena similaris]
MSKIKTYHVTSMNQSTTLMVVTWLAFGLRPSWCWCETRCEQSIPSLYRLRAYWSRSFKRVGEQRVSFEQFLLSLVQQSASDDEVVKQLRSSLLRIIGRYQDCVMACEHQFSKRNQRGRRRKLKALCQRLLLFGDKGQSFRTTTLTFYCPFKVQDSLHT